jgi:hypothetical protein
MQSANVGVAAGNTAEKYLQDGPEDFPCDSDYFRSPRPTEIDAHVAFLSGGERKRNRMVRDQVSREDVTQFLAETDVFPLLKLRHSLFRRS